MRPIQQDPRAMAFSAKDILTFDKLGLYECPDCEGEGRICSGCGSAFNDCCSEACPEGLWGDKDCDTCKGAGVFAMDKEKGDAYGLTQLDFNLEVVDATEEEKED